MVVTWQMIVELFVLAIPIACVARTVVFEDIFREPREYCMKRSQACRGLIQDLPEYNKDRDGRWPEGRASAKPQSWLVAAAVERGEVGASPQRLVAVGANRTAQVNDTNVHRSNGVRQPDDQVFAQFPFQVRHA